MGELCDIYDRAVRRTGGVFIRGSRLGPGQYQLAANLWIFNRRGFLLIQRRSARKEYLPGIWATHGGGVRAGETARQACVREAREEIGIRVNPAAPHYLFRDESADEHLIVENFIVCREYDAASAVLQPEEVSELRWATPAEIRLLQREGRFFRYFHLDMVENYMARHRETCGCRGDYTAT